MLNKKFFKTYVLVSAALLLIFPLLISTSASAQDPRSAYYSPENDRLFWFIHVSDLHIGARGSDDNNNLTWLVGEARTAINPEFIVAAGDLTDSTNGNLFGWPNGPWDSEWIEYRQILISHGIDEENYYDIPGNHDAYSDRLFTRYLDFSIQGLATGQTQHSWIREFNFGDDLYKTKYHFLGVNTAGNNGASWTLSWPHGDYAGLDALERVFIQEKLEAHSDATLTMIFGHHPLRDNGDIGGSTYLQSYEETSQTPLHESGADEFIGLMDANGVSMYGYGHVHDFSEQFFTDSGNMAEGEGVGVYYLAVDTLGKSPFNNYNIIAIDSNGISIRNKDLRSWPAVVITTPVDVDSGVADNPYTYDVPNESDNPIRALVFDFDVNSVTSVQYSIDGGIWQDMVRVPAGHVNYPYLWEALWNASGLLEGHYNIEVRAFSSSGTDSDMISTNVYHQTGTNNPPVAAPDTAITDEDIPVGITLTATDIDEDPLNYYVVSFPEHGNLSGSAPDLTYTPDADYYGPDSFTFKANDGTADSNVATVSITVYAVNDAPVADDQSVSTNEDIPVNITLTATDPDNDPLSLTYTVVSGPSSGSLSGTPPNLTYTPNTGYSGPDSFIFKVNDGTVDSDTATVTITVNPVGTVDKVTILSAVYKAKPKRLVVEATSSAQPEADLTVVDYGVMSFSAADGKYIFNSKVSTPPVSPVTVTSDLGGSDTRPLDSGGGGTDPPPTEEFTIVSAEYKAKAKRLLVKATSTPDDVLTLYKTAGLLYYGTMTYSATEGLYVFRGKVQQDPRPSVTVTSGSGESVTFPL